MIFRVKRGPLETVKDQILIHGELLVDTTDWIIRMGDSETPGGQELSNRIKLMPQVQLDNTIIKDKVLVVDSDNFILRMGDGVTPGGIRLSSGTTVGGSTVNSSIYVDALSTIDDLVVSDGILVADNENYTLRVGDGTTAGGHAVSTKIIIDTKSNIDTTVIPVGYLAVDTDQYILRVGDGSTSGGIFLTDDYGAGGSLLNPPKPPVYSRMITETRVQIIGDTLSLSNEAKGGLIMNSAFVYDDQSTEVATEYTCHINTSNYTEVVFDSTDGLNGKYATVSYMSTGEYIDNSLITTVTRELISSNQIVLPTESIGDIAFGYAKIFDSLNSEIYDEYTCSISGDKLKCLFDSNDNLNGKYATFSYQSVS